MTVTFGQPTFRVGKMRRLAVPSVLLVLCVLPALSAFNLSQTFTDYMVLQVLLAIQGKWVSLTTLILFSFPSEPAVQRRNLGLG